MDILHKKYGYNPENIDTEINPKEDFYMFACGGWMKSHPMPPEFSSYGTFDVLREKSRKQVKDLILNLSSDPEAKKHGSIAQKISDLYNMGMDEKKLNDEGASPIQATLSLAKSKIRENNLTALLAWLHLGLDSSFFSSGVGPDPADSDLNILHLGETGLGLGDRDYYLEDNDNNRKIIEAYKEYIRKLMTLTGYNDSDAERVVKNVLDLERKIALIKMTREERRNPLLRHNIYDIRKLEEDFNFIDWPKYFEYLDIKDIQSVNVTSVNYFLKLKDIISEISLLEMEDYIMYSLISNSSSLMSDEFTDADFEMFGKVMSGQKEKKPRWKRAMSIPDSMFGEAVGQLYVEKYFPKENKEYMLGLVENLRKSLSKHISDVSWMSKETKIKALEKLSAMKVKIGYPDKWKDYSEIDIDPKKSYLENVQEASVWFAKDNYAKIKKPVDKSEWHMTPQTVNAYYSPVMNEICFPAAILQPPYFDINAEDALNYGAIGVIIGHEMTHGFDDQGRQFDKDGNLSEWWTKEDSEKFNALADKLVEQFDKIEIAPGVHANGRFTLGENIADQGGVNVSLTAYLDNITESETIGGFTPLQQFFLAYAGVWASHITEEEKLVRTKTDPHSLGKYRTNATLKNVDDFYKAFEITEGDKMFLSENQRVTIW